MGKSESHPEQSPADSPRDNESGSGAGAIPIWAHIVIWTCVVALPAIWIAFQFYSERFSAIGFDDQVVKVSAAWAPAGSILAAALLYSAVCIQRRELGLQREELEMQRVELQKSNTLFALQRDQLERQAVVGERSAIFSAIAEVLRAVRSIREELNDKVFRAAAQIDDINNDIKRLEAKAGKRGSRGIREQQYLLSADEKQELESLTKRRDAIEQSIHDVRQEYGLRVSRSGEFMEAMVKSSNLSGFEKDGLLSLLQDTVGQ